MPTLAETLASGVTELGDFNALLAQYLDALAALQGNAVFYEFWVNPVGGDNTNDGLTPAEALQTIGAAVAKTPPGSYCNISLLSDYTMEADIAAEGRVIRVAGRNSAGAATSRQFVQTVSGGQARRLLCDPDGAFWLFRLDVILAKTAISVESAALCAGHQKSLLLRDCGVDVESGVTTASLMSGYGVSILVAHNITALDDAVAGSWIEGVSAGTNPNTLGRVLTNLATL